MTAENRSWSGYFLALAYRPLAWLLRHFFGFNVGANRLEDKSLKVYVKTFNNRSIPLELLHEWTVLDIKLQLASILDVQDHESIGIILAGRELGNDIKVGDCDLGQQTILHAVQVVQKATPASKAPLNEELVDLQITGQEREQVVAKASFFVYCKSCQPPLQPGKLRVRCFNCQEGSILVHRDPCGWSDVLEAPGKIAGHCLSSKCPDHPPAPVEFYFKCSNQDHLGVDDQESPPLYQILTNIHEVPCLACADTLETVFVFECEDRHVVCLECLGTYVKTRLNERQLVADKDLGYTIGCPVGCGHSLIAQHKHFLALLNDKDDYDRYHRFAAEECLLQAGGVLCPQPGCGAGIMPDDPGERKIKCPQCLYVFCKSCHQGFHLGECSDEDAMSRQESSAIQGNFSADVVSRARWHEQRVDNSSILTIKMKTKPCPKCRTPTERDGGCMHMECTRCNFQWCWLCQCQWTRDCMASHWFS